jgi:tetratricopeptide (TPR) repeat protein
MELSVVLYHEYVHHLMNQRMDVNYPRWYMEGMAELLSATTIVGDKFTLGAISQGRANDLVQLGALSVAQLINPGSQTDSSIYQARFYASAWLLTHFLQLSPLGTKSQLKSHTTDYLLRLDQGEDTLEAFVASYGMTPDEMDKELRSYQRQRRVTVLTANINPYEGDIGSRVLSEAERAYLLADMAWQLDKEDVALEYLRELGDDRNNDARALSLHAVLENTYGDPQRASRLRTAALALGEDDSQVHSNLARMDWYSFELSSYALSLDRSLRHGKRAAELDPDNLEAYKYQWMAHAAKGEEVAAISAMMAAFQLYPTSLGINAEIGTYLLHLRKPALARPFLQRVYNWSHSEEQRTALKETLARIDAQIAEEERLTVP